MKKKIALLLLAAAILMLAACGHKAEAPAAETVPETQAQETQAAPLEYAGIYRQPYRDEIAGGVIEGYSYIVLNEDHTGYWITQGVAALTWDEELLKTNVGEICRTELTQENGTVNLLVYPDPHFDDSKAPKVFEKTDKLPAEMEAMIAEETSPRFSESDYPGAYCRTWFEEIGGTSVMRNSYYVLNADHTGYVITQGVGKLTWNMDQVTDDLGQTYSIAMTEEEGWVKLLVYEFPGSPSAYDKLEKLPADVEAMLYEDFVPIPMNSAPEITKNPTSETVTEGGYAYFVARADNYKYIDWYIVSADRSQKMNVGTGPSKFPGLSVSGDGTTTLLLSGIPLSMNGWCIEATFTGDGGSTTTNQCKIYVNKAAKTPLLAVPSGGFYVNDHAVQLTAAPGSSIYYELYDDVGNAKTGTIRSGDYVYVPVIANCRYIARLVAHVVGDENNLTVCEYTMDGMSDYPPEALNGATEPPCPSFNGGNFDNNEVIVTLEPLGDGGYYANIVVLRLCNMEGTGSYHGGVVYMSMTDPSGNYLGAEYDVVTGTLNISSSTWEYLPSNTVFYGIY